MKKIVLLLILSLSMMAVLAGCKGKENGEGNNEGNGGVESTPTPDAEKDGDDAPDLSENPVVKEAYDYNDYIKLGQYKGIEVSIKKTEVTDEDIDIAIQMDMFDNDVTPIDITDRAAKRGDTLNIDFVGYHNGEAFEGGSSNEQGYDLTLGSNTFIEGFEEQLIGLEVGDEADINVVFPENYDNTTLAGEPAVFKVKINSINYFELTEEFITDTMSFDTEEEYRESLHQYIEENNSYRIARQKESDVYNAVIKGSEITLPENLIDYYVSDLKTFYESLAAGYGMSLEDFVVMSEVSMEEFDADLKDYAKNMATRELMVTAISAAENIEVTEDEFQAELAKYVEEYGYESKEAFLENADENIIKEDLLFKKVISFLVDEAVEKYV